jgi:hypothetical protein
MMVAALAVVVVVSLTLAWVRPRHAVAFVAGAGATWAALFAWRTSTARVVGANLWLAGFVLVAIPAVAIALFAVVVVARWRSTRLHGRGRRAAR